MTTIANTEELKVEIDLSADELIRHALANNEGVLADNGALCVTTGKRTGRSPKDRFIVKELNTEANIDWGVVNQPFDDQKFETLWQKACHYIEDKQHFARHAFVGADNNLRLSVKVITELAWHNLFARQLFIRPQNLDEFDHHNTWTILSVPNMKTDPSLDGTNSDGAVLLHLTKRRVLICGIAYAGEMKKAMFTIMNYLMPEHDVLPMHCSANVSKDGDSALFFGLSGTGKTTLSADPARFLIGDDEHGWCNHGIFNFEGGCYAKCINLSQDREPMIWHAIKQGAVMENVILDDNLTPKYDDASLTENTRVAYPLEHIERRVPENRGSQPKAVIFLTCDLYGVLPPVSLLTKEQAAYHFLSGYTALVGSTEVGQAKGIRSTFSTCFGAPFFPRPPKVYAELLIKQVEKTGAPVYLVNTGWTGGAYGSGERFSIPTTRAIITAILNGELKSAEFHTITNFKLQVPKSISNVDSKLLTPVATWANPDDYAKQEQDLIAKFKENFNRFDVPKTIAEAGPN